MRSTWSETTSIPTGHGTRPLMTRDTEASQHCPSYYEKKTRLDEDYADLVALLNGINNLTGQDQTDFLFENFDLPGMINYLAVNCLIHNNDFTHKNYYLYRDSNGTQRWVMHPWDMDLTFGRVATWPTGGVLNDGIYADNDEIPDRPDVSPQSSAVRR